MFLSFLFLLNKNNTISNPDNPVKDGFIFEGWYLGDEKFDFSSKIKKDITLIAKWEKEVVYLTGVNYITNLYNNRVLFIL